MRKKVLIVEDDESVRRLVRVTLAQSGFEVVEARDGAEGLRLLDRHRPDAVVLDLVMPDLGGERMLSRLRAADETKRTPVVIITGMPEVAPEVIGLVGRENIVPKPFDPDMVIARLEAILG